MFINHLLLLKATTVLSFVNKNGKKKKKKGLAIKKIHSRLVTKQNTEKQNQKKSAREREQFSSEGR